MNNPYEEELIELINQSKMAKSVDDKLNSLSQAQEILLRQDRSKYLLKRYAKEFVFMLQSETISDVKIFIIKFIEETTKEDVTLFITDFADHMLFLLNSIDYLNENHVNLHVMKQAIISFNNIFKQIMIFIANSDEIPSQFDDPVTGALPSSTIEQMMTKFIKSFNDMRNLALKAMDHSNDALRLIGIRFSQTASLCFSFASSQRKSTLSPNHPDAFSLSDLPRLHPYLVAAELEEEGKRIIDKLAKNLTKVIVLSSKEEEDKLDNKIMPPSKSYIAGGADFIATTNTVTLVAVHRPSFRDEVIESIITAQRTISEKLKTLNEKDKGSEGWTKYLADCKRALQTLKTNMLLLLRAAMDNQSLETKILSSLDAIGAKQHGETLLKASRKSLASTGQRRKKEDQNAKSTTATATAAGAQDGRSELTVASMRDWNEALSQFKYPPTKNTIPTEELLAETNERMVDLIFVNARNLPRPPDGWVPSRTSRGQETLNKLIDLLQTTNVNRQHLPKIVRDTESVELKPTEALQQRKSAIERMVTSFQNGQNNLKLLALAQLSSTQDAQNNNNNVNANDGNQAMITADGETNTNNTGTLTSNDMIADENTGNRSGAQLLKKQAYLLARISCNFDHNKTKTLMNVDMRTKIWDYVTEDLSLRLPLAISTLHCEYATDALNQDKTKDKLYERYDASLQYILEKLDVLMNTPGSLKLILQTTKTLPRFFVEIPRCPKFIFGFIIKMCENDRNDAGLTILRELLLKRPNVSNECFKAIMCYSVSTSHRTRERTINLIKTDIFGDANSSLYMISKLKVKVKEFALGVLDSIFNKVEKETEPTDESKNTLPAVESLQISEKESPDMILRKELDDMLSTFKGVKSSIQSNLNLPPLPVTIATETLRKIQLYMAICQIDHKMIHHILYLYPKAKDTIQMNLIATEVKGLVNQLVPAIGTVSLLKLIDYHFPIESSNLVIEIITKCVDITKAEGGTLIMLNDVMRLHTDAKSGIDTPIYLHDIRFLVPVAGALSKLDLIPDNGEAGLLTKFAKLKGIDLSTALENILCGNPPALVPSELLIHLSTLPPPATIEDMRDATSELMKKTAYLNEAVLTEVLMTLIKQPRIPEVYLRIVIKAYESFPRLKPQILKVLEILALREVWNIEGSSLGEGFIRLCSILKPESFPTILRLPIDQLKYFVSKFGKTKELLRNYIRTEEGLRSEMSQEKMEFLNT